MSAARQPAGRAPDGLFHRLARQAAAIPGRRLHAAARLPFHAPPALATAGLDEPPHGNGGATAGGDTSPAPPSGATPGSAAPCRRRHPARRRRRGIATRRPPWSALAALAETQRHLDDKALAEAIRDNPVLRQLAGDIAKAGEARHKELADRHKRFETAQAQILKDLESL